MARVEHDSRDEFQELVAADLVEREGLHMVKLDVAIAAAGPSPQAARQLAETRARELVAEMGAAVLIWGRIVRFAGQALPELHLTVSREHRGAPGRYRPTQELRLPSLFWKDLTAILQLVVLAFDAEFKDREGQFVGDILEPFVSRVRRLLADAAPTGAWDAEAEGLTRLALGEAELLLGDQTGERRWLEAAIETLDAALGDLPPAGLERARAESRLATACRILGDRDDDRGLIERAVTASTNAVGLLDPETDPIDWAHAQNDCGNALLAAARREASIRCLEDAVDMYRQALKTWRVELNPLDWAQTHNNLGVALWQLGERIGSVDHLQAAVSEIEASLEVYLRAATPLDWAEATNNLGLVAWTQGELTGEPERFRAAIGCYRQALRERRRADVPLLWAQTQSNLGIAFWSLGEATGDVKRLRQAVRAFGRALTERTADRAPSEWAETQNNLGAVLWSLGERSAGCEELERAVAAYEGALAHHAAAESASTLQAALLLRNLGNALSVLGQRRRDRAQMEAAVEHIRAACAAIGAGGPSFRLAEVEADLALAAQALGEAWSDPVALNDAQAAYCRAAAIFERVGRSDFASALSERADEVGKRAAELQSTGRD